MGATTTTAEGITWGRSTLEGWGPVEKEFQNTRVLVLEDDPQFANKIEEALNPLGIGIDKVSDMKSFYHAVKTHPFDLATLDTVVGKGEFQSGREALHCLSTEKPEIARLVFPSNPLLKNQAFRHKADFFVPKPLNSNKNAFEEFCDAVKQGIRLTRLRRIAACANALEPNPIFLLPESQPLPEPLELKVFMEARCVLRRLPIPSPPHKELLDLLQQHRWWRPFMAKEKEGDPLTVEKFRGWIERLHHGIAYLTLKDSKNRSVEAKYDASLLEQGLEEGDYIRGTMEYQDKGEAVMIFHPAPQPMISEKDWQKQREEIEARFQQARQGRVLPSQVALERLLAKTTADSHPPKETPIVSKDEIATP